MKTTIIFFSLLVFCFLNLKAQIPDLPLSFTNEEVAEFKKTIESYCLPYIDNEAEKERHKNNQSDFVGLGIHVNIDILRDAKRYDVENGCVYIYKIESSTAQGLQLFYSNFFLANDSYMFVYGEKKLSVEGPLTSIDNLKKPRKIGRRFRGNVITIEYFEPANSPIESTVLINYITHWF